MVPDIPSILLALLVASEEASHGYYRRCAMGFRTGKAGCILLRAAY